MQNLDAKSYKPLLIEIKEALSQCVSCLWIGKLLLGCQFSPNWSTDSTQSQSKPQLAFFLSFHRNWQDVYKKYLEHGSFENEEES